jgi:hypothetical protein
MKEKEEDEGEKRVERKNRGSSEREEERASPSIPTFVHSCQRAFQTR